MANLTVDQVLEQAVEHHQRGRLAEAETLYLRVLTEQPRHAHAIHLLGVLTYQKGQLDQAVELIYKALSLSPREADYYANLSIVLHAQGRREQAIAALRQMVELRGGDPDAQIRLADALLEAGQLDEAIRRYSSALEAAPQNAMGWNNLGYCLQNLRRIDESIAALSRAVALEPKFPEALNNLANALFDKGDYAQAITTYRRATALRPDYAEALCNLAAALKKAGNRGEGVAALRQAVSVRPDYADGWFRLAGTLLEMDQLEDAIQCYRHGLTIQPARFEEWNNLGNTFQKARRPQEAMNAYRQAISHRPEYADAWNNLGNVLQEQKQWDEAIAHFQRALAIQPDFPEAWNNLGNALDGKKEREQAIAAYRRAIEQRPEFPNAWYNLSNALHKIGDLDQAIAALNKAIEQKPDYADAYQNLGNVLKDTGRLHDAIAAYRQAIELNPGSTAESCLLLSLLYSHEYAPEQVWEEHVRWDQRVAKPPGREIRPHPNDRTPDRRLRIGYVSGDFRHHVVGYNMMPLFREHDHSNVEIFCYSNTQELDAYSQLFQSRAEHWRDIKDLTDDKAAELIREDRIDILVDLSQHTGHNRLLIFARKPAPVQVAFAGYPGSTGLSTMDYRLTDPYLDPPEVGQRFSTEKPMRLPDAFWCYDPLETRPPVGALPAGENGFVTFGCLNNFCKVNEPVLSLWSRVMHQVSRSRLLMLAPRGAHRERTVKFLESLGIEAARVEFVGPALREPYLRYYNRIDVGLDTFPYNGHTTSLDSYCMGVPVVTIVGNTSFSRAGWCQLTHLNLRELAAESEQKFVKIAADLASDLPRLSQLRAILRDRLVTSPLMDPRQFARNIENAYRQMWVEWCRPGRSSGT